MPTTHSPGVLARLWLMSDLTDLTLIMEAQLATAPRLMCTVKSTDDLWDFGCTWQSPLQVAAR